MELSPGVAAIFFLFCRGFSLIGVALQLLGRASSTGAFVKRGEESGYIKISLRGEFVEEKITITRKIDTQNRSEWMLNGMILYQLEEIFLLLATCLSGCYSGEKLAS